MQINKQTNRQTNVFYLYAFCDLCDTFKTINSVRSISLRYKTSKFYTIRLQIYSYSVLKNLSKYEQKASFSDELILIRFYAYTLLRFYEFTLLRFYAFSWLLQINISFKLSSNMQTTLGVKSTLILEDGMESLEW